MTERGARWLRQLKRNSVIEYLLVWVARLGVLGIVGLAVWAIMLLALWTVDTFV